MDTAPRYNFKDINVHDLEAATLFEVRGYVAVVTGAGNGVGLMAAQTLAANGARVYIIGTREEILDTIGEKYSFKGQITPCVLSHSIPSSTAPTDEGILTLDSPEILPLQTEFVASQQNSPKPNQKGSTFSSTAQALPASHARKAHPPTPTSQTQTPSRDG